MENVPVCERVIKVWENVRVYVRKAESKEVTKTTNKSYKVISKSTRDKLIKPKLEYFLYIAKQLQAFLGHFQTDRPMFPFLFTDLNNIVRSMFEKVLKPEAVDSVSRLPSIDQDNDSTYLPYSKVEIGFSIDKILKEAQREFKLSDKQMMEFRIQCRYR